MAITEFSLNDALAVQRFSTALTVETDVTSFFTDKFVGTEKNNIIEVKQDLEKQSGESITVAFRSKISGTPIEGDNDIDGTSSQVSLSFADDKVYIDQQRFGVKTKKGMTQQRVPYKLRKECLDALSVYFAELTDQEYFMYLAGARGVNSDYFHPTTFTGRANNSLQAPDSDHIIYGGTATGKADLATGDKMTLGLIERLNAKADTYDPMLTPLRYEGEKKFILLMHTWNRYDLRVSTTTNDWMDLKKAADSGRGKKAGWYKNILGEYGDVVMHVHRNTIRFDDYGASGAVAASRMLFLGAQAGISAYGGYDRKSRYLWHEEAKDAGNKLYVTSGNIMGCKKTRFNSKDLNIIAVDVACANPNS